MSLLIKKSDIRNHLIVRRHERNRLYLPLPQPDTQVISSAAPDAIKADLLDFAQDFMGSLASIDRLTSSISRQAPARPASLQE